MSKKPSDESVRRNITMPASFSARLEALKKKRGGASDSEVIRQAITLLEAATDPKITLVFREKGRKDREIKVI